MQDEVSQGVLQARVFETGHWSVTLVQAELTRQIEVYRFYQQVSVAHLIITTKNVLCYTILVALGLFLPALTGISSWLTPVAAVALAMMILMVALIYMQRREKMEAALNVFLLLMLAFVAYIR
jgi:hypothetical protein